MSDLDSPDPLCDISSIREAQAPLFRNVNTILVNRLLRAVLTSLGLVVVSYIVLRFTDLGVPDRIQHIFILCMGLFPFAVLLSIMIPLYILNLRIHR